MAASSTVPCSSRRVAIKAPSSTTASRCAPHSVGAAQVLIRALRINTLSKLTHGDTAAFNSLVNDVFPGATVSDVAYDELEAAVKAVLAEEKLEVLPLQVGRRALHLVRRMGGRALTSLFLFAPLLHASHLLSLSHPCSVPVPSHPCTCPIPALHRP